MCATRVCKPGSVLTAIYLSLSLPAGFSRLLGAVGQTYCSSTALLRDRVYIVKPMSPWAGWALTPPFHPCLRSRRYISVALVLRSPSAGVTRYPCPVKPGLSSPGAFRHPAAAVQPGRNAYSTPNMGKCQIERGACRDRRPRLSVTALIICGQSRGLFPQSKLWDYCIILGTAAFLQQSLVC